MATKKKTDDVDGAEVEETEVEETVAPTSRTTTITVVIEHTLTPLNDNDRKDLRDRITNTLDVYGLPGARVEVDTEEETTARG